MQDQNQGARPLYRDIAERTQGDLYIGVVGPVRTGKSTFIKHFMEQLVLPLMAPGPRRDRLNDELPQSGSGKTVMTTQPQFIPGEGAAQVQIEPGVGTRVLRASLENKYDVPVTLLNVKEMRQEDMQKLLSSLLLEFPLREVRFSVPGWMGALDGQHWLLQHAIETVRTLGETMKKMRDKEGVTAVFAGSPYWMAPRDEQVLLGEGILCCDLPVKEGLFNQVLSEQCGETITGDAHLLSLMKELVAAKREYDRVAGALKAVQQTGYGLVTPAMSKVELQQPVLMRQGSRYGVRLKASVPTLHLIRSDIETEIAPVQSGAFVDTLRDAFEKDPPKPVGYQFLRQIAEGPDPGGGDEQTEPHVGGHPGKGAGGADEDAQRRRRRDDLHPAGMPQCRPKNPLYFFSDLRYDKQGSINRNTHGKRGVCIVYRAGLPGYCFPAAQAVDRAADPVGAHACRGGGVLRGAHPAADHRAEHRAGRDLHFLLRHVHFPGERVPAPPG